MAFVVKVSHTLYSVNAQLCPKLSTAIIQMLKTMFSSWDGKYENQSKKYRPRVTELMEHTSLRWTAQDSPSLPHLESRFFPPLIALSQCLVETVQTVVNVINIKAITNIAQNNTWYNQFLPYPALSFCAYWAKQVQQVQPEEPHMSHTSTIL